MVAVLSQPEPISNPYKIRYYWYSVLSRISFQEALFKPTAMLLILFSQYCEFLSPQSLPALNKFAFFILRSPWWRTIFLPVCPGYTFEFLSIPEILEVSQLTGYLSELLSCSFQSHLTQQSCANFCLFLGDGLKTVHVMEKLKDNLGRILSG